MHSGSRWSTWLLSLLVLSWGCSGSQQTQSPSPTTPPSAPAASDAGVDDADPNDEKAPAPPVRPPAVLAALLPTNGTGCAPGARCIRTSINGRPQANGNAVAQCRGEFPDFIVPRNTIPAGYAGPWFVPNLIENAHTGIPQGTRPWRGLNPQVESQRLAYAMTLRNYAFASEEVRKLTPNLTADSDYFDPVGRDVPAAQRSQKWYPAPRMMFGNPSTPGTSAREAAFGMTLERRVRQKELAGNTQAFVNYAVAYYDARGARTYARVWSTATPGRDTARREHMKVTAGGFVFKLLYSAAPGTIFPGGDILAGSLEAKIIPNANSTPVTVRLLQIDIAVKDDRAGPTGWYFATYAYDSSMAGTSPWRKMVPVGLMWGNDPNGPPIAESWINPAAPQYARDHLGVDGRLNGPVDNPDSACMSCHSTAQAPSLANILPPASGACLSERPKWFRNLPGTMPFGRFDPNGTCESSTTGITLTAADYSLQLGDTVTRAVAGAASFNPCTWDDQNPPPPTPPGPSAAGRRQKPPRVFPVTRDPEAVKK
jgi:hypothetical protein